MITCPWCGTSYVVFQSNCSKCGGPLQAPETSGGSSAVERTAVPPSPPRTISENYIWRLLFADGQAVAAFVFALLGFIFCSLGAGLTLGILTAFIGIPFLLLGMAFLVFGGWIFYRRYRDMQKVVDVLRTGESTRGQIIEMGQDFSYQVNGRSPWVIRYQYQVNGKSFEGKVSTLNAVEGQLKTGKNVCILYLPAEPQWSSIYPHP